MDSIRNLLIILFALLAIVQCQQQPKLEYEQLVKTELDKGVRNDSLFLGYHFGMTREEFYDHSWKLNKQKHVVNGNGAEIMQEVDNLKSRATKIFYPEFKNEKIVRMPVKYSYNGWAPWNRHLWADSLKYDVKNLLEEKYSIKFNEMNDSGSGKKIFYEISANKEIRITEFDKSKVLVQYIDLTQFN